MAFIDKYGVEYSDDKRILIQCPKTLTGKYVILEDTLKIASNAFLNSQLSEIVLNRKLNEIASEAFAECRNIEQIIITDNVLSIADKAFRDCENLNMVTFGKRLMHIGMTVFVNTSLKIIYWNVDKFTGLLENNTPFITYNPSDKASNYDISHSIREFHFGDNVESCPTEILDCLNLDVLTIGKGFVNFFPIDTNKDVSKRSDFERLTIQKLIYNTNVNIEWSYLRPKIEELVLGEDVKIFPSIWLIPYQEEFPFNDETNKKDYHIPEGVEELCSGAFPGSRNIKNLYLPKTLKKIAHWNLQNCKESNIVLDKDNPSFVYKDGVLYYKNNDAYEIVAMDSNVKKDWDILEGVKTIDHLPYISELETIRIPQSVEKISYYVLSKADNLKTIYWNAVCVDNYQSYGNPFASCGKGFTFYANSGEYSANEQRYPDVEEIFFGDEVRHIPQYACANLPKLKKITIGKSVRKIGENAFLNCTELKEITILTDDVHIEYGAFGNTKWLKEQPDGLVYIANCLYACKGELTTKQLTISDSCKYIATHALSNQKFLEFIECSDSITTIENSVFSNCSNLTTVKAPYVQHVQESAFRYCSNLKNISFGKLKSIGNNAFSGCAELVEVDLTSVTELGHDIFDECPKLKPLYSKNFIDLFGTALFAQAVSFDSIVVKRIDDMQRYLNNKNFQNDNIKSIVWDIPECKGFWRSGSYFSKPYSSSPLVQFKALEEITFTDNVLKIPDALLYDCEKIRKVNLGNTIQDIGNYAFYGLVLDEMIIPQSLTSIYYNTFTNLKLNKLYWNSINCNLLDRVEPSCSVKEIILDDKVETLPLRLIGYNCETIYIGHSFLSNNESKSQLPFLKNLKKVVWNVKECHYLRPFYIIEKASWSENKYNSLSNVSEFVIGSDVEILPVGLFVGLKSTAEISFENINSTKLSVLPEGLFESCEVKSFTIPSSVSSFNTNSFNSSVKISLCDSNPNFQQEGDIIYNSDKSEIIYVNSGIIGDIILPDSIKILSSRCFANTNIVSITFPDNINEIPSGFCENCKSLKSVHLGKNVTKIGKSAFSNCNALTDINLSDSIIEIADFALCRTNISIYQLPKQIRILGTSAIDAQEVFNVVIPESLQYIAHNAFGSSPIKTIIWNATECLDVIIEGYQQSPFSNSLVSFIIGGNVKRIPANICRGALNLNNLSIPRNVIEIGDNAFSFCKNLKFVHFDEIGTEDIISLKQRVFSGTEWAKENEAIAEKEKTFIDISSGYKNNNEIREIVIPEPITEIRENSFYGCSMLKVLEIPKTCEIFHAHSIKSCKSIAKIIWKAQNAKIIHPTRYSWEAREQSPFPELRYIKFTESVQEVPNFDNILEFVTTIEIGANVSIINDSFAQCSNLERFVVHPKNQYFACDNGVLYNKEKTKLIHAPAKLEGSVYVLDSVEEITPCAFSGCKTIDHVYLPDTCKTIGANAFNGCKSLEEIILPHDCEIIDEFAFKGCSSIKVLRIPENVKSLFSNAFNDCDSLCEIIWAVSECEIKKSMSYYDANAQTNLKLSSLKILDNVRSIPANFNALFLEVDNLKLGKNIQEFGDCAFMDYNCIDSLDLSGVQHVGYKAFAGCKNIQSLTIPKSVLSIGNNAFSHCEGLENVTWQCDINVLPEGIFEYCSKLISFTSDNKLVEVGASAFSNCISLSSIDLSSVETIKTNAFFKCSTLKEMDLSNLISIEPRALSNTNLTEIPPQSKIVKTLDFLDTSIQTLYISKEIIELEGKFDQFEDLERIDVDSNNAKYISLDGILYEKQTSNIIYVPKKLRGYVRILEGVKELSDFSDREYIDGVILPSSVERIGYRAFDKCTSLDSIIIPKNTKCIEKYAFDGCANLSCVYIESSDIKIEPFAFEPIHTYKTESRYGGFRTELTGKSQIFQNGVCINDLVVSINNKETNRLYAEDRDFEQYCEDSFRAAFEGDPEAMGGIYD